MNFRQLFYLFAFVSITVGGFIYANNYRGVNDKNKSGKIDNSSSNNKTNTKKKDGSSRMPETKTSNGEDEHGKSTSIKTEGNGEKNYDSRKAQVLKVYDGDSLRVRFLDSREITEIRIKGIDCPESSEETDKCWSEDDLIEIPCEKQVPLGIRAKSYALSQLEDEVIRLESYNDFNEGDYGRTLAYVRTPQDEDYGLKTVKKGYCKHSGVRYDHPRDDQYEPHEQPIKR